jgi:hypothetical protein
MRVDVMRPTYNFEPKYRVVAMTREEWITGTGTPPSVKGHVWFTDGSRMWGGTGARCLGSQREGGSVSPLGDMPQSFRLRCLPSWLVLMI